MRCATTTRSWGRCIRFGTTLRPPPPVGRGPSIRPSRSTGPSVPNGFLRRFDLRPELSRITAPTLILAGQHDWICPPEFSEEIHRLIPHSDYRLFRNSSHSIRADEPDAMLDAILGFVVYRTPAN